MDKFDLFTLVWTNITVPMDAAGARIVAALMAKIGPWFKACVGAYLLVMMLIASWTGDADAGQRLFRHAFLAAIVYAIAFTAPAFNYYVPSLIHGTTAAISTSTAGIFRQGGGEVNAGAYDIIGTRAFSIGLAVFKNLPFNPGKAAGLSLAVVVYWFISYWAIVIMFSVSLVSYVLGDFVMDFGPLFVPLYFFPFTRKYFDGWLSCVLAPMLVQIFTAALAALFVFVLGLLLDLAATGLDGSKLGEANGGIVIGELMMLIATALFCCIFAILAGVLVYVAVRITGGAHAELGRLQAPSWMPSFGGGGNNPPPPGQPQAQITGPHHGGAGGGIPPGPGTAGYPPARGYAFQRTVGNAP